MNDSKKSLLPALLAVGSGIAAAPASAVELGDVNIQSTIGQPLRASIAYALGTNEQLADYCVTLNPGLANKGLPAITSAKISVANGVIALTGRQVVREPLMTLRLNVDCPYTPKLSREYMLFMNPAVPVSETAVEPAAAATTVSPSAASLAPAAAAQARPAPRRATVITSPVDPAERYHVQRGDTLSEITARIKNRPVGLWNAVAQIFDANPDAFVDNNPDHLVAGSWLVIPEFGTGKSYTVSNSAPAATSAAAEPAATSSVVPSDDVMFADPAVAEAVQSAALEAAVDNINVVDDIQVIDDTEVLEPANPAVTSELQADTAFSNNENPFVDSDSPAVVIPDTALEAPASASSPNVPTARIAAPVEPAPEQASTSWLLWLVGGGIGLIAGLLLFGRRNRRSFDPAPMPVAESYAMPPAENDASADEATESAPELHDDSPTEENLALDADLIVGTGLRETGMHVNEDFGFATETNVDIELPEDDDYDMSVNVDATKISPVSDVTERDLKAVQVDGDIDYDPTDNYTINQEIDYQILEQDYLNELTATQALNVEIEKAAAEIAKSMEQSEIDDLTSELHLATVTELDATANQLAEESDNDEVAETGTSQELTVEMPADGDTVQMPRKTRVK